ncbi:MAG: FHA domain-containing protein [Phycisphaerales bacterium]|nr:FHA domain-containing protein [Phycisphaerales bacterium]
MKLALIMQTGSTGDRTFPINGERTVIGRDGRCDLRLPLPTVSPRHCEIAIENRRATLLSSDPASETLLNGVPVDQAELSDEDTVCIGPVTFRVSISSAAEDGSTRLTVERDEN